MVPAFTTTGVDFTGNLFTKAKDGTRGTAYVCLFTCAVTRAIHLQVVPDMSTKTFMHAFRRFAARRSLPTRMLSDNASTYLAAADEIKTLFDTPEVNNFLAAHRVQWTFIPKRAPWFGGFWERLIALTKNAIKKTLGRVFISFDELSTVVTEIEAVLNDRPLTYVSSSIHDKIGLTPNHLLHGRTLTSLPYIEVTDEEVTDPPYSDHHEVNKRYEHLSRLHAQFWRRWSSEYLTALRERHLTTGSRNNVIKVGDVVIIHSDTEKRQKWHLGTVTKLIYDNDKLVQTNRPIQKLYPLEVVSEQLTTTEHEEELTDVRSDSNTNTGATVNSTRIPGDNTQKADDVFPRRPMRDSASTMELKKLEMQADLELKKLALEKGKITNGRKTERESDMKKKKD
ncbi:uncharacterized protein [Ptychodera flava]|uniref:uncharacterized protein n=1 Tax=Ptychodera flava TaxID=63121 RepID=UPI003969F7CF